MKKMFFCLYCILIITSYTYAWSYVVPSISNRSVFHQRKGQQYFQKKDYARAIAEFELAYDFSFTSRERNNALIKKVVSMMRVGNYDRAINVIDTREREREQESEFLFIKAECLQRLGKTNKAIVVFDSLIYMEENENNKLFYHIKEGLLFLSLDSLDKGEKTFSEVMVNLQQKGIGRTSSEDEQLKLAIYSLGYIAFRKGNYGRAERFFWFLSNNYGSDNEFGPKSALYYALTLGIEDKQEESKDILEKAESNGMKEAFSINGYLFYRNREFDKAIEQFQVVVEDTFLPTETEKLVTILSGECSYFHKDYGSATEYYRKYAKLVSSIELKKPALYGLAWAYFRMGKYSNAYAVLKDILVLFPESEFLGTIEKLSALSLFYMGEHREAKYHFSKLLALDHQLEDKDRIYYLRGKSEFYLHEYDKANDDFQKIISDFPVSRWKSHSENMIAKIYFETEDYAEAYRIYSKLLSKTLSSNLLDEVRLQTERCLLHLGYYNNPIEMSKVFVRKYPESSKSPDMQLEIAEYYFQLQRYWEAIREYERFLNLFKDERRGRFVLFKLAGSYLEIGYFEKSLEMFNKLISGKDEYAESALLSMGDILFSKERFKESIDILKELTKRFPKSNMKDYADFVIGKSYLELNMPKEARVSFERVVKSKQIFEFKEKSKLLYAKTLYLEGKGEDYLSYLEKLINTGKNWLRVEAYFLKAEYKKEIGRFREAMDLYEQSSELFESNLLKVKALYEAGLSAEAVMLFDKAIDYYTQALNISEEEGKKLRIEERIKKVRKMKLKETRKQ